MSYKTIWKSIIRPPREVYSPESLGPIEFTIQNRTFKRKDLILRNPKGLRLECSHFEPIKSERAQRRLPCVVYLHCNAGSRLESLSLLKKLLTANITLFTFDFSGCGISEGKYISLGWYEAQEVKIVIDYLRSTNKVSYIGLWGRSMGAVTALLYGQSDPSIAAIVADSPFASLKQLIKEQARKYSKMPGFIISVARKLIKNTIKKKVGFSIDDLNPINHVSKCFIPALFCHAVNDNFVTPIHTEKLCEKYAGESVRMLIEGDHNSKRPKCLLESAAVFFYNAFQCEPLPPLRDPKKKSTVKLPKVAKSIAPEIFQKQLDDEDQLINSLNHSDD